MTRSSQLVLVLWMPTGDDATVGNTASHRFPAKGAAYAGDSRPRSRTRGGRRHGLALDESHLPIARRYQPGNASARASDLGDVVAWAAPVASGGVALGATLLLSFLFTTGFH
jgi:hypothetical protein